MQIILLKDVEKLGLRGDVVDVARGYARNYLLPRKLAEDATPARVAELKKVEAERARHEARSVEQAQEIAELLGKTVLRFEVNVRRGDMMQVSDEAGVSLTVNVSGTGMPAPYETTVSSAATVQELFALPSQLQHALLTAANSAVEEAVRGIRKSAASGAFPKNGAGGGGNPK